MMIEGPALGLAGFAAVLLLIVLRVPWRSPWAWSVRSASASLNGLPRVGFVLGTAPFEAVFPVACRSCRCSS